MGSDPASRSRTARPRASPLLGPSRATRLSRACNLARSARARPSRRARPGSRRRSLATANPKAARSRGENPEGRRVQRDRRPATRRLAHRRRTPGAGRRAERRRPGPAWHLLTQPTPRVVRWAEWGYPMVGDSEIAPGLALNLRMGDAKRVRAFCRRNDVSTPRPGAHAPEWIDRPAHVARGWNARRHAARLHGVADCGPGRRAEA
jgi:hypothetical protein